MRELGPPTRPAGKPGTTSRSRVRPPALVGVLLAGVLAVVGILLVLPSDEDTASAGRQRPVSLAMLAQHPQRYVGQTVTVTAIVDPELEPSPSTGFAFLLGKEAEGGVLVVPRRPDVIPAGLEGGDQVRITGEVLRVAPAADEGPDILGEGGLLERYAQLPSIKARDIELLP